MGVMPEEMVKKLRAKKKKEQEEKDMKKGNPSKQSDNSDKGKGE